MANGLTNWSPIRSEISSASRSSVFRRVEVPELALDHAEVGGFRSDEELVVPFSKQHKPLGHPLAGLGQVAGDLGADAEEVQRVRASGFVGCRLR